MPAKFWTDLLLKLVPIVVAILIKQIVSKVSTRFIFLNRKSKILAVENFRAFNVFVYFNFFFDCFMGYISAIIRLIKAVVIAVFMLPSKLTRKHE